MNKEYSMRVIYKWSLILVVFFTTFVQAEVWVTGSYGNNTDISQELSVANATSLVVTVEGRTERYYDFVYIYDENGQLIRTFDGQINSTFTVNGSSITARLTSDYSITSTGVTVTALADNGTTQELIQGGGNGNGVIDPNSWTGQGMSYNNYVGTRTYQAINYLNNNPIANNGGSYQAITTVVGNVYTLRATLIGANHYTDAFNYTLGSSYITIEDNVPTPISTPNYTSEYVLGNTPRNVEIVFTATSTTTYVALRGNLANRYPNASMISVTANGGGGGGGGDTIAPIITLNGAATVTLTEGGTFTDPGATAQDNVDGTVTVTTTGTVDINTAGRYTLTYRATDAAGNTATATRTVIVTATTPTNATLIHHWSLNEENQPYLDIVGNTNGTCFTGTCPVQTGGQIETAQLFDGAKIITVTSNDSLNYTANESYAVEFWMSAQDSTNNQVAIGRGLGGTYLWIGTRGTKVRYQLPGGPSNATSTSDITLNEWTHIVVVKNANTQQSQLYINGTLDSTNISNNTDFTGNYNLEMGGLNGQYRFNGSLDNVKLYRGLLSAGDIQALYNSASTGNDITPPFITIRGDRNTVITAGSVYTDPGATAQDIVDGTVLVTSTGTVNVNTVGTYTITYTATDSSGNTATASRIVTVEIPNGTREFAFYADEYNDFNNSATGEGSGNRILQVDLENMTLTTQDVPGILGHHADSGYNSKIYAVPKGSNYLNVIEIRKDEFGNTTMNNARQIDLIHKPRSGDAHNPDLNVILMTAKNRPMGSFINVQTDQVVGTIGEEIDCRLTDGSMLLSHADANTHEGALLYQCANDDHGGDQISGHPYWLTNEYAAIVDRANRQIHVYRVTQVGNTIRSQFINSLDTRTSIHQIINRDRSALPAAQQSDYYAIEEGKHVDAQFNGGIPHALIHMRLTNNGLELVRRIDLQRTEVYDQEKSERILETCVDIYRNENNARQGLGRTEAYQALFTREGVPVQPNQDPAAAFPVECVYAGIPGGHNGDFAPNNRHVYVGMAGGLMSVIDVNRWTIVNNLDIGRASGPGHTCFSANHDLALTTQHAGAYVRVIRGISSDRPYVAERLVIPYEREGLTTVTQSHSCHVDDNQEYYYNAWTDGGVIYKMDLQAIEDNTANVARNMIVDSVYTGGMPIQGSFLKLDDIQLGN